MSGPSANKVRVQAYIGSNKSVYVDTNATQGAQIGVNLWDGNGKLITQAQWNALVSGSGASSGSVNLQGFTTDDLDEGAYNLYFTKRRAQDAVGEILQNTGSITFEYVAGMSITAQADLFYLMAIR